MISVEMKGKLDCTDWSDREKGLKQCDVDSTDQAECSWSQQEWGLLFHNLSYEN